MRIAVYSYDANPSIDPPSLRISEERAVDRVRRGFSGFVLNGTAIQNYPPENAGDILNAGERDWKVIHSSRMHPSDGGGSLRISTLQLITRERLM